MRKNIIERVSHEAKVDAKRVIHDGGEPLLHWFEELCRGLDGRQAFYAGLEGLEE